MMGIVATPGLADAALSPLLATMARSKEFGVAAKHS
jgi:hypothetical protein